MPKHSEKLSLTTEAGTPVIDNQHSQTAGPAGPTLLQDHLIEKLARFNRERIPERIVHAVGTDPRGFAIKFYTEDGNWDLVGNNTPVFFIRDGIKFPDFFSHSPEATHQFTWLFGDRGLVPAVSS